MLGEVVFGGVGAGLYGMLMFAILAVFIAGLMVGRTPEYLGKKIERKKSRWRCSRAHSSPPYSLLRRRQSVVNPSAATDRRPAAANTNNPAWLSEILYAYTSATGNNGSAFAGINANTPWYNITLGFAHADRPLPDAAAAARHRGLLAQKKQVPASAGTFPTHGPFFVSLLVGVVLIVGALNFLPCAGSHRASDLSNHLLYMQDKTDTGRPASTNPATTALGLSAEMPGLFDLPSPPRLSIPFVKLNPRRW